MVNWVQAGTGHVRSASSGWTIQGGSVLPLSNRLQAAKLQWGARHCIAQQPEPAGIPAVSLACASDPLLLIRHHELLDGDLQEGLQGGAGTSVLVCGHGVVTGGCVTVQR